MQKLTGVGKSNTRYSLRGYLATVVDATKLSVSAVTDYLYCPRCAYQRHVLRLPYEETIQSVRGQAYHHAFEWFLSEETKLARVVTYISEDSLACKFNEELLKLEFELTRRFNDKYVSLETSWEREITEIKSILEKKFRKWLTSAYNINQTRYGIGGNIPNRQFEVFLKADRLGISGGKVDMIEDGIPVEIKTGYVPHVELAKTHLLQLVWYALLLEHTNGIDVNYGEVYYTRIEQRRSISIDAKLRLWAFKVRNEAANAFRTSCMPEGTCRKCNELKQVTPDRSR